ncbi:hypothetical protein HZC32_00225 [Candidatus Woesearchaeota archaeon]|nr:hypothetical protein [Candidatus Woesearchaeota archaeon]
MDETSEKILLDNAREFTTKAEEAEWDKTYITAVTLYFKAIAVVVDLFILKTEGTIPSNHTHRFRILEEKYPLLYALMDKDFPLYQQSYKLKLDQKYVEVLKNDFRKIVEFTQIKLNR